MLYTLNQASAQVLGKLAAAPRLRDRQLQFSPGWHEKGDREKGMFIQHWGRPASWREVILQGPHIYVNTPLYKQPNETMLHNQDWSFTDLETLEPRAIPITAYKPSGRRDAYDAAYTQWGSRGQIPARDFYRVAWRYMAANKNERTLISAILPPGAAHTDGIYATAMIKPGMRDIPVMAGTLSSLLADFLIRSAPKSTIRGSQANGLPFPDPDHFLASALAARTLRLNCVTNAYADLWRACFDSTFIADAWTDDRARPNRPALGDVSREWTASTPLRIASDRRQAQAEIDALVALMLRVTAEELCTIYRTQFAVLYGYDHDQYTYDANGRLVPNAVLKVWRAKGYRIAREERTHTNQSGKTYVYELPFSTLDREADMRRAYSEFERRLAARETESRS
jgi:hypothetical protein